MDLIERPAHLLRRHPWEEARFRFFYSVLARRLDRARVRRVLDAGSGDAWFAQQLAGRLSGATIVCWDTGYTSETLDAGRLPQHPQLAFRDTRPSEAFDLVLLLDVLEHVENDREFLRTIVGENVAASGHVLISVPAWPLLFSEHDVRLRHYRRYTPRSARALIHGAGLEVIRGGGLFHSLLFARLLQVSRDRLFRARTQPPDLGGWSASEVVTACVRGALACDNALSRVWPDALIELPGLSWWALCRRRA